MTTIQSMDLQFGCCDFQVPPPEKETGKVTSARSMEYVSTLPWVIGVNARNQERQSKAPSGEPGFHWTSQYGFVGVRIPGMNSHVDGMNEKGLSIGALTLKATKYQDISDENRATAMRVADFSDWILGSFETCAEVKENLEKVSVWGNPFEVLKGQVPLLHFALHDREGNAAAIEFLNGKAKFRDNPTGILTNDPKLPWHQENLRQYNLLTAKQPDAVQVNQATIEPLYATGTPGLPGGFDTVSRHVRLAKTIQLISEFDQFWKEGKAKPVLGVPVTEDRVNRAEHLLNIVDRPLGSTVKEMNGMTFYETTQWTVIRDHSDLQIHYNSYEDQTRKTINLAQLKFDGSESVEIPMTSEKRVIEDVTWMLVNP